MTSIADLARKARRGFEKIVAPGANLSYAQAGEDLVLDFLTDYAPRGFYVDVGCNHAKQGSNSFRFYRKGWRGIAIDANLAFGPEFRRSRPGDRFVQACVSDTVGEVDFHLFEGDALSSISGTALYDDPTKYAIKRVDRLITRTLDDILAAEDAPASFEFLSIDVEGHDEAVLRSLDLNRYRPSVILVEANGTEFGVGQAAESWPARHLFEHGYRLMAVSWSNLFFKRGTSE